MGDEEIQIVLKGKESLGRKWVSPIRWDERGQGRQEIKASNYDVRERVRKVGLKSEIHLYAIQRMGKKPVPSKAAEWSDRGLFPACLYNNHPSED